MMSLGWLNSHMGIVAVKIFLNWTSGCGKIAVKVCIELDLGAMRGVHLFKCLFHFKKIFYYFLGLVQILQILI